MSTAVNKAIYARLTGGEVLTGDALAAQTALAALLAVNPRTTKPAVHFSTMHDLVGEKLDSVRYPCITFRPAGWSIDGRFADGLAVGDPIYDLEYWDTGRSGTKITDIDAQVEILLDRRRQIAPVLPLSSGICFWIEMMTELAVIPDKLLNAWVGLRRLRIVEGRY